MPCFNQHVQVSGIGGVSQRAPIQSISSFQISPLGSNKRIIDITAVVVPKVTCDLPLAPIPFQLDWHHIANLPLADPGFGQPGRIDLLLRVDVLLMCYITAGGVVPQVPLQPSKLNLAGYYVVVPIQLQLHQHMPVSLRSTVLSHQETLQQFWEIEESPADHSTLSAEERMVVQHFNSTHSHSKEGRFIVPLPRNPSAKQIGETRSQVVRFFLLECS